MKGDKLGRQNGSGNGDHEGRQIGSSGSQEQPRMEIDQRQAWKTRRQPRAAQKEIMKGDKLGRQGGSGSQEQPRMEIMEGDKLGRQGGSQEQPRTEIIKGDKLRRQRGSGSQEHPRMEVMNFFALLAHPGDTGGGALHTVVVWMVLSPLRYAKTSYSYPSSRVHLIAYRKKKLGVHIHSTRVAWTACHGSTRSALVFHMPLWLGAGSTNSSSCTSLSQASKDGAKAASGLDALLFKLNMDPKACSSYRWCS